MPEPEKVQPARTPQNYSVSILSPLRQRQELYLKTIPSGYGFCGAVTCDIEKFDHFVRNCRAARRRPPSLYAYVARCLGITLAPHPELLASRLGNTVFVPSRIDAVVAVEVNAYNGEKTVRTLRIEDLGNRTLAGVNEEMKNRLREAKRTPMASPLTPRRFVPARSPIWWRQFVENVRERRPKARRARAMQQACVQLSSTSQWMEGRIGWGVRLYRPASPSVTMAGVSRRAVVVGDEIVSHLCLDLAIIFDHALVDGAPATRFIAALMGEIESGRALGEYSVGE